MRLRFVGDDTVEVNESVLVVCIIEVPSFDNSWMKVDCDELTDVLTLATSASLSPECEASLYF